jgi:2'-5' RNA ligase
MSELRSFVAVPLPAELQARILAAAGTLAARLPDVKWSRKVENLHVTIKFLGQVAEERLAALGAALDPALRALAPFSIDVRGLGAFPSEREARVVWAGIDDATHGLAAVARVVETESARLGFARDERTFRAHVTVGRSKGRGVDARRALAGLAGHAFGSATVGEVHIYESRLGSEGSTYVLRSRSALGATASN